MKNTFLTAAVAFCLSAFAFSAEPTETVKTIKSPEPISIGSQRQLFLDDDYLIASMENAEILVGKPIRREIATRRDRPWEGSWSKLHSVLYDPQTKKYMMFATGAPGEHLKPWDGSSQFATVELSDDGIHWTAPTLGFHEFNGSKENNIVVDHVMTFAPFIDENPAAKPEERFKGISTKNDGKMVAWFSADGLHWTAYNDREPVYAPGTPNAFDSHNVAFWSTTEKKYVVYYRARSAEEPFVRSAERAVSDDFIHWTNEGRIRVPDDERPTTGRGEFYTNQIAPYYRAPQIYLGFPSRYTDYGFTESYKLLPEQEERALRLELKANPRLATATTDSTFFASRDGINFRVANDVFLAPGLKSRKNWSYGDNFIACGVVETQSTFDDCDDPELSIYATESSLLGDVTICRRYTLRVDGFASIHAKTRPGVVVTDPLIFDGAELSLNAATSALGTIEVEICDESGAPIPGFERASCDIIYGDSLDRRVSWKASRDVSSLAGKPVVLKFYLREADIYSLKFEPK